MADKRFCVLQILAGNQDTTHTQPKKKKTHHQTYPSSIIHHPFQHFLGLAMEYQYTCHHLPETTPPSQRKPAPCAIAGSISSHSKTLVACSYHGLLVTLRPASTRPLEKFVLTKWPPNKCVNRLQYIGFHRSVPPKKKFTYGFLYQENHRGSLLTPIKNQPRITRTSGIISWKPQPMDLKKSEKQKKQVSHFRKKKCSDEPAFFPLIMA